MRINEHALLFVALQGGWTACCVDLQLWSIDSLLCAVCYHGLHHIWGISAKVSEPCMFVCVSTYVKTASLGYASAWSVYMHDASSKCYTLTVARCSVMQL